MSRTVLIVDDSMTESEHLREVLGRNGFHALCAHSGDEALALARLEAPDVILMDLVMPGLNGFQATRELSRHPQTAHIPVIVVSSKRQTTDRIWALRQGAREYLVKPVPEPALLQTIRTVLG